MSRFFIHPTRNIDIIYSTDAYKKVERGSGSNSEIIGGIEFMARRNFELRPIVKVFMPWGSFFIEEIKDGE